MTTVNTQHRRRARARSLALSVVALTLTFGTIGPSGHVLATMPGDNDLIAFSAATESGVQLFTVRPDGTDLRQITRVADGSEAVNVDWSPDGRRMVFAIAGETSAQLATVRADGTGLRMIPQPDGVFDDQPSFSPDGRRIFFERYTVATDDDAIWSMALDGSGARRVVGFPNGFVTDPNVSPDGRTLSFQGFDGSVVGPPPVLHPAMGLFTADLDGGHVTQIRPFTADETIKADWAPDGRRIAVTENANFFRPDDAANIVTMRPDGSRLRHVTDYQDADTNAFLGSYSPDGRWLVFRLGVDGRFGLYRMHPDGTHRRTILPLSTFKPYLIDWGS